MAKRIAFWGKGSIGKSTLICQISEAMAKLGLRVLQIGNDCAMSSTVLLRGKQPVHPVMAVYRREYEVDLRKFLVSGRSGVFCLELGGVTPGCGCVAKGIDLADAMLEEQGILDELKLDVVLYDITAENLCVGQMLPVRDGLIHSNIIVTDHSLGAFALANCFLEALEETGSTTHAELLMLDGADCCTEMMKDYQRLTGANWIGCMKCCDCLRECYHRQCTVSQAYPGGEDEKKIEKVTKDLIERIHAEDAGQITGRVKALEQEAFISWHGAHHV